jgi:hypothetical protein
MRGGLVSAVVTSGKPRDLTSTGGSTGVVASDCWLTVGKPADAAGGADVGGGAATLVAGAGGTSASGGDVVTGDPADRVTVRHGVVSGNRVADGGPDAAGAGSALGALGRTSPDARSTANARSTISACGVLSPGVVGLPLAVGTSSARARATGSPPICRPSALGVSARSTQDDVSEWSIGTLDASAGTAVAESGDAGSARCGASGRTVSLGRGTGSGSPCRLGADISVGATGGVPAGRAIRRSLRDASTRGPAAPAVGCVDGVGATARGTSASRAARRFSVSAAVGTVPARRRRRGVSGVRPDDGIALGPSRSASIVAPCVRLSSRRSSVA